jgi:hypothetical protein
MKRNKEFLDCNLLRKTNKEILSRIWTVWRMFYGVLPIHFFQAEHRIQFRSRPMRFLGFSNHEKGAPRQEVSKWSTVCSTFSRSECSVVRSASLAKGDTSKNRPSPHLHKVPTRSNKVSPWTFQRTLVCFRSMSSGCWRREVDLWNVGILPTHFRASQLGRPRFETSPSWKPQNTVKICFKQEIFQDMAHSCPLTCRLSLTVLESLVSLWLSMTQNGTDFTC